jgi:predicted TIM-barrel fold metal-dependent hydrolase
VSNPRRIDVHHHIVPPDYAKLLEDKGLQPGGIPLPSWTMPVASKIMRANRVETAILSVSTPGVWFGDVPEARLWARRVNDHCAAIVEPNPRGFGFFATLTLPDVDGAIAEATYALDALQADGVILLANNAGRYLGDPEFDRLLGFLHERRAVVFVHPGELPAEPVPGIPTFTADFLLDTTRTAVSLILSGALEKYDGIRWILAHAGGFVPYISHRILLTTLREEPKWKLAGMALRRKPTVADKMRIFQRFQYDTALSSTPATFPSLLAVADPTKILFGSDYPFAPAAAVKYMRAEYEDIALPAGVRDGIDRRNAEVLFPRLAGGRP